ncbi:outer membrane protein transport protein [Halorhodospira halochloris]|uniref:OmpP1/FadL family transporter n=1 Tax=Halorhodospira halochloris TaxID=1052 RepID=UPI001EE9A5E2|nr:outer membrane protein transport protein [Halorhodospira halochloris]MCG5531302.1 outer membrane protein transport protein [Halorhodospira halochloris]
MPNLNRRLFIAAPCLLTLTAFSGGASAAAFQLQEQSASLLGSAFAGRSADAHDISHMYFNPATLGVHLGHDPEAEVVLSYISPTFDFEAEEVPDFSQAHPSQGEMPGQQSAGGGEDAFVPVFYAATDIIPGLRFGLGINVPYGMETDYPEDWVGRYDAVNTDLMTIDINPALGWRVNEQLALGFGLSAQYADANLSSMLPEGGPSDPNLDGKLTVEGDSWAYGFNLGAHFTPTDGTQLGIAYRHGMGHTLEGDADYQASGAQFTDDSTDGEADLDIPASVNLGIAQQLHQRWTLLADATWTQWSDFEELAIEMDDPGITPLGENPEETYDWDDTWMFSLGTRYDHSDQWDFRFGVAYDQTPTSDRYRTPRIPDEDRTWVALGGTWQPEAVNNLTVDFAYTYIWLDDAAITLAEGLADDGVLDDPVAGEYESNVQVVAASANWRF